MSKDAKGAFDSQRVMTQILIEQGHVPTGGGGFIDISEDAAKVVSEEVGKNTSFTQDEPESLDI